MFKKPILQATSRLVAESFKPPGEPIGPEDMPTSEKQVHLFFVTADGKEHRTRAEPLIWARARGEMLPGRSITSNKHSGYDVRMKDRFIVVIARTKTSTPEDVVIGVHIFPKYEFDPRSTPSDLADVNMIEGSIDQVTGEIVITQMPLTARPQHILQITTAIDKVGELKPGMDLVPALGARINSIVGPDFKITLSPSARPHVTSLSEAMAGANP